MKIILRILFISFFIDFVASSTWRWFGTENSWVDLDGLKMQSVIGGGHSGGGMCINTLDMARFGLLLESNGNWNGDTLLSENSIKKQLNLQIRIHITDIYVG